MDAIHGFICAGGIAHGPELRKEFGNIQEFWIWEHQRGLFSITKMMIEENSEINNVFSADAVSSLWEKSVLLNDQAITWTRAIVYIYSDSVSCLGKCKTWNDQVSTLKMCHTFRELQGLDGEPIDFEWKIFPGATALDLLHEIQKRSWEKQHLHLRTLDLHGPMTWKVMQRNTWKDLANWRAKQRNSRRKSQHHALTTITEMCSNPGFLLVPKKNYRPEQKGNRMQKQYLLGPGTWKVTQRNVLKDIANLQI